MVKSQASLSSGTYNVFLVHTIISGKLVLSGRITCNSSYTSMSEGDLVALARWLPQYPGTTFSHVTEVLLSLQERYCNPALLPMQITVGIFVLS